MPVHITNMAKAYERYQAALTAVQKELPSGIPSDRTYVLREKALRFYLGALIQECTESVTLFDLTTETATEISRMNNFLLKYPLEMEHFVPTDMSDGDAVRAMKIASEKCKHAIMSLEVDIASLRSAALFSNAQLGMETFKSLDDTFLFQCKILTFLLDFIAEIATDLVQYTRSMAGQHLERERNVATVEPKEPVLEAIAGPIDRN